MNRPIVCILITLVSVWYLLVGRAPGSRPMALAAPAGTVRSTTTPGPGTDMVVAAPLPEEPPLGEAFYVQAWEEVSRNVARLQAENRLSSLQQRRPLFLWPLEPINGDSLNDFGYYTIAGLVDHNPNYPGELADYACHEMTYDTGSGYNHKGTDFLLSPFPWRKMDGDEVAVVAAAPGQIVYKHDGEFDRSCTFTGEQWNAIYLRHQDGSFSWYGHLKNGSTTSKEVGDWVAAGEQVGTVGSSGNSTTPHLHFEVYDADRNLIDPFAGACNATTTESWWAEQPPYKDTAVNKLATGFAPPETFTCPSPAEPNMSDQFVLGEQVYFTAFLRHLAHNATIAYTIRRPDNSVFGQWQYTHTGSHYPAAWVYRYYNIDTMEQAGEWRFEATLAGTTYSHTFWMTDGVQEPATSTPTSTATPNVTASPSPAPHSPLPTPGLPVKPAKLDAIYLPHMQSP